MEFYERRDNNCTRGEACQFQTSDQADTDRDFRHKGEGGLFLTRGRSSAVVTISVKSLKVKTLNLEFFYVLSRKKKIVKTTFYMLSDC